MRHAFAAGLAVLLAGQGAVACAQSDASVVAPDPVAATCRPQFAVDGQAIAAGTAFVLDLTPPPRPDNPLAPRAEQVMLVTALHLFGPNGGLPAQILSADLPQHVGLTTCRGAQGQAWTARRTLAIAGAVPMAMPFRDVAGFATDAVGVAGAERLRLADRPPAVGDDVWVVAAMTADGRVRRHAARVIYVGDNALQYVFVDATLQLRASSGAAVVNAAGQVVGLHLGGGVDRGDLVGMAVPPSRLRALVEAAQ
ncbi:hypothetical protein [Novosphingobium ovatum]|uniref:hypothetical protein n=1 Tax=Novosphingobium ovatum TaxID=1908523 RepID=UPI001D10B957|nr:hypothetical protein [Novosphingobium ovatum]